MHQIQHLMRKYKRYVLVVTLVLVVVPFVIWGGYRKAATSRREGRGRQGNQPVAVVGPVSISRQEFHERLMSYVRSQYKPGTEPSREELKVNGTVDRLLGGIINSTLVNLEAEKQPFSLPREYEVERLKAESTFKTQNGQFDARKWNNYIDSMSGRNWNAVYNEIEQGAAREAFMDLASMSARVTEDDVKRAFEDMHTRLVVKYAAIEPPVKPADEEIQKQYEDNPKVYERPEERTAEFVAISLRPPRPELADELVKRARAGEDFAELAKANSEAANKEQGGDMGWVSDTEALPDFERPLFELKMAGVSDPVEGPDGYYIFKVEEEKKTEGAGQRSVHARQIVLKPKLDDTAKAQRKEEAQEVAEHAKATGELEGAAEDLDLKVQVSGPFSASSRGTTVNVPPEDGPAFRSGLSKVGLDEVSDVIEAVRNLYVGKIVKLTPAEMPPLATVRDKVVQDTIASMRRTPEYQQKARKYAEEISAQAKNLADIRTQFPDLMIDIKETKPFSMQESLFSEGLFVNNNVMFGALRDSKPGALAGPINDFMGRTLFLELVERIPPTDSDRKDKWPEEKETLRKNLLNQARQKRLDDFIMDLHDRMAARMPIRVDEAAVDEALGIGKGDAGAPETSGEAQTSRAAESAPADAAQAPTQAAEPPSKQKAPAEKDEGDSS